jgi:hypothetical protein
MAKVAVAEVVAEPVLGAQSKQQAHIYGMRLVVLSAHCVSEALCHQQKNMLINGSVTALAREGAEIRVKKRQSLGICLAACLT